MSDELVWNGMQVRVVEVYATIQLTAYVAVGEDGDVSAQRIGWELQDAINTYAPYGNNTEEGDALVVTVDNKEPIVSVTNVTELSEYSNEDMASRVDGMHGSQSF